MIKYELESCDGSGKIQGLIRGCIRYNHTAAASVTLYKFSYMQTCDSLGLPHTDTIRQDKLMKPGSDLAHFSSLLPSCLLTECADAVSFGGKCAAKQ